MRVLICEDDPIQSMSLEMIMEECGHEVVGVVARADQALIRCWRSPPDLVLVDLNLADGRTGPQLVEALAKLKVPAIIVSSEAQQVYPDAAPCPVVQKPFHEAELIDAVANFDAVPAPRRQGRLGATG